MLIVGYVVTSSLPFSIQFDRQVKEQITCIIANFVSRRKKNLKEKIKTQRERITRKILTG